MLDAHSRQTEKTEQSPSAPAGSLAPVVPEQVTIGLIGQVKAGKSSLINAILGEQRARTNVLPETREVTRYELSLAEGPTKLELLDTIGYGHTGPRQDQLPATQDAARQSDILLLVLHARTAARQPDLLMLQALRKWFNSRHDLKMPRVVAVITHIDLLAPAVEWTPPYNWQKPQRVKEQQISEAVAAVREQFGDALVGVVPVCVAEGRTYGVQEWLLPTLVELLDEGRAVAMLRCLCAEVDAERIRKVFNQLLAAGKEIAALLQDHRSVPRRSKRFKAAYRHPITSIHRSSQSQSSLANPIPVMSLLGHAICDTSLLKSLGLLPQ